MVNWEISKTELWKNKKMHEKEYEIVMKQDDTWGLNILMAYGQWIVMKNAVKNRKEGKKWNGVPYIATNETVDEFFKDTEHGAQALISGGVNAEDEKMLRNALMLLNGAEFC